MTNFYTYQFLTRQPSRVNAIIWTVFFILVLVTIISLFLFLRHRDDGKYRELTIITILCLLLTITIQYDQWNQNKSSRANNGQVASLIKRMAYDRHLSVNDIYSNSTNLKDGMLIKVKDAVYEVELNSDNSSFQLHPAHLTNPKINLIK
ncbi:DUF3290 domain-containing protein [Bombilactobacillus bombi]|uniref:DUF3290 domain-containing protein n=1 Tax=Bombilactobacillus bombi TaxID=1303590 RepID=UPI0015E5AEAE|nr:DUF3290 domain-containing protein [Bombilactobacillus bombi]MBA1434344.1 DUF3290 domain-containing protein [Bombilactobacillus bombi]